MERVAQPHNSTQCIANCEMCGTTMYPYIMHYKNIERVTQQYNPISCIAKPLRTVKN